METRKIKPYPAVVPDDIEPVSETWHTVGKWMIGAVLAMLVVFFVLMFFSGVFLWSLIV
jgi:ABC-type multidrug transport system permease subunit